MIKTYLNRIQEIQTQAIEFEATYKNKPKGEIYEHRLNYLINKLEHLRNSIEGIDLGVAYKYRATVVHDNEEISTILIWYSSDIELDDVKSLIVFKTKGNHIMHIKVVDQIVTGVIVQEK